MHVRRTVLAAFCALALLAGLSQAATYRLRPADRQAVSAALDRFVVDAVQRRDVAASYDLVTPYFRAGVGRRAWAHGTTTVSGFPARGSHFGWTLDQATPGDVVLDALLQPRKGAKVGAMIFTVEL